MSQIIEKAIARAKHISNGDAYTKLIKARAKLMKGHVGMASILLAASTVSIT